MSVRKLFYGDNLQVLRDRISDESVDLIYLDPPFNSNASYNILFREPTGQGSESQIEAFNDSWQWNDTAELAFDQVRRSGNVPAFDLLDAMRRFLGTNAMMAYLTMMAIRLIELHRVLKPTGSIYLHCDPTASHYLKLLMDAIFGFRNYRNEISWKRSSAHSDVKQGRKAYGNVRDIILYYTKTDQRTWNAQYTEYSEDYLTSAYRNTEPETGRRYRRDNLTAAKPGGDVSYRFPVKRPEGGEWEADPDEEFRTPKEGWEYRQVPPYKGRYWAYSLDNMKAYAREGRLAFSASGMPEYKRYLDEMPGVPLQNAWNDISPATGKESLGYPTQKPLALLERILAASSNKGDVVLDPFCGCGTAVHAAEKLGRQWIGIDVTYLAISLIERRMKDAFPDIHDTYQVIGAPRDLTSAEFLAGQDKFQFECWAISQVDAYPKTGKPKKGADSGIDGVIYFAGEGKATERAVVQVKAGANTSVSMIRDLKGVMERERSPIGVFITVSLPTRKMEEEAASAGVYHAADGKAYPRLQIITLAEIFQGRKPAIPLIDPAAGFRRARREESRNGELDL